MLFREEIYGFSLWPLDSVIEEGEMPINCRIDEGTRFELLERRPMPYPQSYEDVYQSREDADIRLSVRVINCESFDRAKEHLAGHLSQCAAFRLPQVTEKMDGLSADIAFGAADGSGKAVYALRGKAVVLMRNIGLKEIDLLPVYETLNERIHLQQIRRKEPEER